MGSGETATATTGGPRVIAYLTGTGRHRVQIIYFLWMQIGSRTPSGIGLGRLVACAACAGAWGSPESSGSKSLANHGPEQ